LGLQLRGASQPNAAGGSDQAKSRSMDEVLHSCVYAYMRI